MTLLVAVDQKESIRRGIAAPDSTVRLEFDPSCFSDQPETRDWIAARFDDGKLTRKPGYNTLLKVPVPNCSGLREAIAAAIAEDAFDADKANRAVREWLALPVEARYYDHYTYPNEPEFRLSPHGFSLVNYDQAAERALSNKHETFPEDIRAALPKAIEEVAAFVRPKWEASRTKLLAKETENTRMNAEAKAKADAKAARFRAQLDAKAAQIGGIFAERHLAGFTVDEEIIARIQADELAARGLQCGGSNLGRMKVRTEKPLSDEQFLALKEFKSRLPETAKVLVHNAWNVEDVEDDEGETTRTVSDNILYAKATYALGEVTITARHELGPVPEIETLD